MRVKSLIFNYITMKYSEHFQGGEISFWDTFPYMKSVGLFKKLYKEDRSKDKNKSSKTMWYLALVKDIDSEFYSIDKSEQYDVVCDVLDLDVAQFLGSQEELDLLLNYFEEFIDTPITSDIRAHESKLEERKKFIQNTPYTLDEMVYPGEGESFKPYLKKGTAAQLDKMMVDTLKIHEEIRRLRTSAKNEQSEKGKGGRTSSFLES